MCCNMKLICLLDRFGEIAVKIEQDYGLVIALDKCKSLTHGHTIYNVFVNGLSYRLDSLKEVNAFLFGYASGVALYEKRRE